MANNWQVKKFEEVFDIQGGSQPPKSNFIYEPKEGYVRLFQIRDFGDSPVPTYAPINKVSKFISEEDVLIARYGASLGRILKGKDGAYNVALAKVIFDKKEFSRDYIYYFLKTPAFQTPIKMISRSAQNGFNKSDLAKIPIPVPSKKIQEDLAQKLDSLFSKIDAGEEGLQQVQQQLEVYRQAVLKKAFEDIESKVVLEDLVKDSRNGLSKRSGKTGNNTIVLRLADIKSGKIANDGFREIKMSVHELKRYDLNLGDLLFLRVNGSLNLVGRAVLFDKKDTEYSFCDHFIRVKLKDNILPEYLRYFFESESGRKEIKKIVRTTAGQNTINQQGLLSRMIPICDIKKQSVIVEEIRKVESVSNNLKNLIAESKNKSKDLRQSILNKAFNGELI